MQPVRILGFYDDLLDSLRRRGNLSMLRRRIEEMGYPSRLDRRSLGEPLEDLEDYHLVYLGRARPPTWPRPPATSPPMHSR